MPLRSPGTTVARTDAEIVEAVEDSAVALAAGSTVGGTAIASTDDVRTDAEIVAAVEASATLDLDAGATIGGVQIASTDDVRTDAEIVAAVEASATLDLDAGATIGGSGIVSDADLALVALDDLADVSVASPSDQDVLTWDDGTSTWVAQAAGGGVSGDVATSIELTRTTATSTGADSVVIGNGASAAVAATRSIAIGINASVDEDDAIAIGNTAKCEGGGYNNISIGRLARTDCQNAGQTSSLIAIGNNSEADCSKTAAMAIGLAADAKGTKEAPVAIGNLAAASGKHAIAIGGLSPDATGDEAIAIGSDAQGTAANAVAIGHDARSTVADAVSLGFDAEATQADCIAIGALSRASRTSSIVLNATGATSAPLTRDSTRINKLHHVVELRAAPSDGTPTEATSDGAAASTTDDAARNVVVLTDGKVASFRLHMTAIQATTNDAAVYIVTGGVKCLAGTASIIGANTTTAYEDDAGWDCAVTCTSNRLVVTCTADAGGASTWRGTLTLTYEG